MATLTAIFQAQDNLSKAMTNAANAGSKTTSVMQKLGKLGSAAMKATGVAIAAASTALLAFGKSAVTAGMNFETSMSQVMATMGMNTSTAEGQAAFETLTAAAEKMGAETAFSASQAADALNYLALAGYDANKAAAALPTVLHLAGAGGMELSRASDMITDSMAALQMEVNQTNLEKFADQMAKTASTTNTSVSQLGDAILIVGATAANLRNGTTELNTQLGILANVGIKGADGGTHLRNILLKLQSPTDKAADMLSKLGVAVYDTDGKMRDTGAIFEDLKSSMAGMDQSQIDQVMSTIFNKTDIAAANALLAASGDEYARIFSIIENSGGAAAEMYQTMLDNLKGDVDMFKSAQEALYLSVYKSINSTLRNLVQTGTSYMTRLNDAFKAGGFDGLVTELGNVLGDATGVIMSYVPKFVEAGVGIVTAFVDSIGDNADTIANAAADIALQLGAAIIRIAPKLAAAFTKVVSAAGKALLSSIPKLFKAVPDSFYNALGLDKNAVVAKVYRFTAALKAAISKLFKGDLFGSIDSIGKAFNLDEGRIASIKNVVTQLGAAFEKVKSAVLAVVKAVAQFVGRFANIGGIEATVAGLAAGFAAIKAINVGKSILNFAKGIKKAGGVMKLLAANKFMLIAAAIGAVVAGIVLLVKNWDKVKDTIGKGIDKVFGSGAWDKVQSAWGKAKSFFSSTWDNIKSAFTGGKGKIEGLSWSNIGEKIKTGVGNIAGWFAGLFQSGKEAAEGLSWSDVGSSVLTGMKSVIDAGGAFLGGLFEAGKAAVEAIPWGTIGEVIGDGVHGIIDVGGAFLSGGFTAGKAAIEAIDWTNIGTTIASAINDTIDTAGMFISGCFEAGKTAIEGIDWANIGTVISTGVNGAVDTAGAFLSNSFQAAKTAIEGIDWTKIGTTIANGVNGAVDTAGTFLAGAFEAGKTAIEAIDWGSVGTTIATAVNGTIDTAGTFLSAAFETAKASIEAIDWAGLGSKVGELTTVAASIPLDALAGVFTAADAAVQAFPWDDTGTKIGELAGTVTAIPLDSLSGVFTAADTAINSIDWATLGSKVGELFTNIGTFTLDGLSGVFTAADEAISSIDWAALGGKVGELFTSIGTVSMDAISGVFTAAESTINSIDWAGLGGKVGELLTVAASVPVDALSGVFTAAESTINAIDWAGLGENVGGLLNNVTSISSDAISCVFTAAEATINSIDWNALGQSVADGLGRAGGLLAGLGDIGLGLSEAAVGAGQKGVNALKGWVSSWGTESASEAQTVGQQIITDVSAGVTAEVPNLVTSAGEAATAFLDALKEKLTGEAATSIVETFTAGFDTIGTDLAAAFEGLDLGAAISAAADGITLEAEGTAIITTFTTGMTTGAATATAAMTTLGTQITAIAQSVVLTAQGSNMLRTLTAGMNSGRGAAIASATSTGSGIRSAFASINLYSVGANIVSGLRNGMQSMFSSLMATARQMASQLKQTIQSGMQVHSPSRFTDWIGRMTGQGLINSLNAMTKPATAAAANMTQGVASAFSPISIAEPSINFPTLSALEYSATVTPTLAGNLSSFSVNPYDALGYNTVKQSSESTERRSFDLNINGNGKISVEGMTKKEAAEFLMAKMKPTLLNILEEEIFTGGLGVYDY